MSQSRVGPPLLLPNGAHFGHGGASSPSVPGGQRFPTMNGISGNWECAIADCGACNWATREACFRCEAPKPPPPENPIHMKIGNENQRAEALGRQLKAWIDAPPDSDSQNESLEFGPHLNNFDRKLVGRAFVWVVCGPGITVGVCVQLHSLCDEINLTHESHGLGIGRRMKIIRPNASQKRKFEEEVKNRPPPEIVSIIVDRERRCAAAGVLRLSAIPPLLPQFAHWHTSQPPSVHSAVAQLRGGQVEVRALQRVRRAAGQAEAAGLHPHREVQHLERCQGQQR